MKKLLNISVIAALAILPMAANADITTTDPGTTNANAPVAAEAPKYSLATADTTDANLATAGYVKGAYNATIKAINKVATTKQDALSAEQLEAISNISDLSSRMDTAEDDIDALVTAVEDKQDALTEEQQAAVDSGITSEKVADYDQLVTNSANFITKDVNDLTNYTTTTDMNTALAGKQDTLTSAQQAAVDSGITSTKVAGYDQLVTDSANFITKDVNDLTNYTTTTDMNTALAGKQDTLTSAQQAAVDSGITSAKVADYDQLVTDSADFITKDVNDLTNYTTTTDMNAALAGKQDALTTDQQAAVDSGITSAKVADYDQLVTDSANYATKAGVLATIDAATVPVMAEWGSTTATTVSVEAPASFVNQ